MDEQDPESFVNDFITMDHPALRGRVTKIDKNLGKVRGGNARSGLPATMQRLQERIDRPGNKKTVVDKAKKDLSVARDMYESKVVRDKATTVGSISRQFEGLLGNAVSRALNDGTNIGGTAWYFDMRRQQSSALNPAADLSKRQVTAMGGRLSASKTPEDERASLGGISSLVSTESGKAIEGRRVRDIPSSELGEMASSASSWNSFENKQSKDAPTVRKIDFGGDEGLKKSMIEAGRAHTANVVGAMQVARGEVTPQSLYNASTTPKTAAYAEMQAQSDPDSDIEVDYRNISSHYKDVVSGKQSADQGMLMFSQQKDGRRAYPLRPDSPVAIDTWMIASGSGQPLSSTRTIEDSRGRRKTIKYSPAKRLVDKDFPLSPASYGKRRLGIEDTPKEITPEAMVSAQHNRAVQRVSQKVGPISFDQFGKDIHLPSSLIQEAVWTESRIQAGEDLEYAQKQSAKKSKEQAAQDYELKNQKETASNLSNQRSLF